MKTKKKKILIIDSMTIWDMQKPHYNGYACGYGPHGKKKYDRNKEKRKPLWY